MKNKQTHQPLKIEDFSAIVPLVHIKDKMYASDYKRFLTWIEGQTTTPDGVFVWDLERFLLDRNPFRY